MSEVTFCNMRRKNQELSKEDCIRVLKEEKRGVLSLTLENGYPYGIPLNYYYDEETDTIYFHGAKEGQKIDTIQKNPKACFTVYHEEHKDDGGWFWYLTSVISFGTIEIVGDVNDVMPILKKFGMKYYSTEAEVDKEIQHAGARVQMLAFHSIHRTGKTVHEK